MPSSIIRASVSRTSSSRATWCRPRAGANKKPLAESNLSLRVPEEVAAQCPIVSGVCMAEVVVFGVVAADVVLRVQRIPTRGDHVNAEALG
jgi:hypothetical protein